jgi:hypothetical protein
MDRFPSRQAQIRLSAAPLGATERRMRGTCYKLLEYLRTCTTLAQKPSLRTREMVALNRREKTLEG